MGTGTAVKPEVTRAVDLLPFGGSKMEMKGVSKSLRCIAQLGERQTEDLKVSCSIHDAPIFCLFSFSGEATEVPTKGRPSYASSRSPAKPLRFLRGRPPIFYVFSFSGEATEVPLGGGPWGACKPYASFGASRPPGNLTPSGGQAPGFRS